MHLHYCRCPPLRPAFRLVVTAEPRVRTTGIAAEAVNFLVVVAVVAAATLFLLLFFPPFFIPPKIAFLLRRPCLHFLWGRCVSTASIGTICCKEFNGAKVVRVVVLQLHVDQQCSRQVQSVARHHITPKE